MGVERFRPLPPLSSEFGYSFHLYLVYCWYRYGLALVFQVATQRNHFFALFPSSRNPWPAGESPAGHAVAHSKNGGQVANLTRSRRSKEIFPPIGLNL